MDWAVEFSGNIPGIGAELFSYNQSDCAFYSDNRSNKPYRSAGCCAVAECESDQRHKYFPNHLFPARINSSCGLDDYVVVGVQSQTWDIEFALCKNFRNAGTQLAGGSQAGTGLYRSDLYLGIWQYHDDFSGWIAGRPAKSA